MKNIFSVVLFLLIQISNATYLDRIIFRDEDSVNSATEFAITQRTTRVKVNDQSKMRSDVPWEDSANCDLNQKCVPYFLCSKEIKNNTDGTLAIDDFADFVTTEQCPKLEKCCSKNHYIPRPENDICKDSFFNTPEKCGWRNPKGLGGELRSEQNHTHYAQYAEFPWMIALLEQLNVNGSIVPFFRGGGSLIHPKVVLTTAHNIDGFDFEKLVIRAGEWDTQTENEICLHEERLVERVIKHEQFNRQNLQNDIALLVLKNEFQLTPFINTICLPPKGSNFDNRRCFTSGWGRNKFGREGFYQVFLKKMDLPIVSSSKCQDQLRKTRLGKDFELHEGFLCAGGENGKDVCTGDGGSPLVCEIPSSAGHYYQAGIVVAGIGCGGTDIPGLYADVSKYIDWIEHKFFELALSTDRYTI